MDQEIVVGQLGTLAYTPNGGYTGWDSFSWNGSNGPLYSVTEAVVNLSIHTMAANLPLHELAAASTSYSGYTMSQADRDRFIRVYPHV